MGVIEVSRYEFKYLLAPAQVADVRRFLLRYCTPDLNARGLDWYGIESLYLDTTDYRFYRAARHKELNRLKLRVRGYANDAGPVKFEVKRRTGDLVTKRSLLVSRDQWNHLCHSGAAGGEIASAGEFMFVKERFHAAPKLLVRYERQAFHSTVDDYVRVTFDRRIQCQPVQGWTLDPPSGDWRSVDQGSASSAYVLEVKFQLAAPAWLRDLVTSLGLERRGFSKYVRGLRRTEAAYEPAWGLRTTAAEPGWTWRVA
jgi:SPX domain protein involved in polyphosphate accumulation